MNTLQIQQDFITDVSKIDVEQLLQPSYWDELAVNHPEFLEIDAEIIAWLQLNMPKIYGLAVESSKRKAHDRILINVIKAKIIMEQQDLAGLRSLHQGRYFKLTSAVFENIYKVLCQKYKKHDVRPDLIVKKNIVNRMNIEPDELYCRYRGVSNFEVSRLSPILEKQPDSVYLNLISDLHKEAQVLGDIYKSVELVTYDPKDSSEYHTCAFCFRRIKLQPKDRSKIAHHGYRINRYSYNSILDQTCSGSNYAPFEISADGTFAAIHAYRNDRATAQTVLNSALLLDRNTMNSDEWRKHQSYLSHLKNRISSADYYFKLASEKLKKTHPESVSQAESIWNAEPTMNTVK